MKRLWRRVDELIGKTIKTYDTAAFLVEFDRRGEKQSCNRCL